MAVVSATVALTSGCGLLPQSEGEWDAVWIIVALVIVGAVGFAMYMANQEGQDATSVSVTRKSVALPTEGFIAIPEFAVCP